LLRGESIFLTQWVSDRNTKTVFKVEGQDQTSPKSKHFWAGAVLEENIFGRQGKKVVALQTQAKTTKSTTPTLQKRPA